MPLTDPATGKCDRVVSRVSRSPTAQTAFALGLLLDYAAVREKADFARL